MSPSAPQQKQSYSDTANPGGFRHIKALDGIRGLAILLVLGDHLLWANSVTGSAFFNVLTDIRGSMWIGVNLFFALSGFLITGILWDTVHKPHFFKTFYARRSLRIFPLYYGVLLALVALTPMLHFRWGQSLFYLATYTDNIALWTRTYAYLPHININHFWSLQVEEQFYLIWPMVVYKVRNRVRLVQIALVTCVIVLLIRTCLVIFHAHFTNQFLTMSPTFSCCDNLLYGCTLALLLRSEYRQRILDLAPKIFTFCCLCLLPMAIAGHGLALFNSASQQTVGVSLLGIGSSALIAMALRPSSMTEHIFDGSFLRFFGKYSYGLYVFHYTIDANLTSPLRDFFQQQTHSKGIALLGAALIVAGLSLAVALLSYHLYEVQFLKLKRFFSYKSHDPETVSEASA